jgi:hypothetical protein
VIACFEHENKLVGCVKGGILHFQETAGSMELILKEAECDGVDCIHLSVDRVHWLALTKAPMGLLVPCNVMSFLTRV